MKKHRALFFFALIFAITAKALEIQTSIDFADTMQIWDGFGFNYVETTSTHDYHTSPQEYGGFSILSEADKQRAVDMVFGKNGLQINLVKMFLDPLHQAKENGPFDHETSTAYMREFVTRGLQVAAEHNRRISIVSTLYGPPAFMTKQNQLFGRDLDPSKKDDLVRYFVDWALYLKNNNYPLTALSLHNEGEGWERWPENGIANRHMDYNMLWTPALVVEFIPRLRDALDAAGLADVHVTPGETWSWDRFVEWGFAPAIARDPKAVEKIGLVTSHGFLRFGGFGRWKSENTPRGLDLIREHRPDIRAWTTSMTWRDMGSYFIRDIYNQIYEAKVSGIIPWAGIKRLSLWGGKGDPNPGGAFEVTEDGELKVVKGYYFYKQVCHAGQAGQRVCRTTSNESDIKILAFAPGSSDKPESFVVINTGDRTRTVQITLDGSTIQTFSAFRTSEPTTGDENYAGIGTVIFSQNKTEIDVPGKSVTTFLANL